MKKKAITDVKNRHNLNQHNKSRPKSAHCEQGLINRRIYHDSKFLAKSLLTEI
jgi:hypothetical protein